MSAPDAAAPRAARLLRWYPKAWRSRYGEEFTELLISDIGERPRSRSRTADVIRGGMVARLADAGLCGCAPEAAAQVRASLASLACCAAVFLGFGRHFGNGWPGTGGHPWARQGLVPGGVAAFSWASTLSVSSFWAHPAALAAFPGAELAWMAVSPLAGACVVVGAATAVRRTELSPGVLGFETRLGIAACITMAVFVAGCCAWITDRAGRTPRVQPGRTGDDRADRTPRGRRAG